MKNNCETCIKRNSKLCPTSLECRTFDNMPCHQNEVTLFNHIKSLEEYRTYALEHYAEFEEEKKKLKDELEEYKNPIKYFKYANKNVTKENKQLKENWNKLKEWFKDNIDKPNIKFILEFMERLEQEININKYIRK